MLRPFLRPLRVRRIRKEISNGDPKNNLPQLSLNNAPDFTIGVIGLAAVAWSQ